MDREDYIKSYLAGQLTEEEREAFEKKLREDKTFAAEFQQVKKVYELLRLDRQNAYRETLKGLEKERRTTPSPATYSRFPQAWYPIAAGLLLLLLPIWLVLTRDPSPESLFDRYFTPYPDVLSLRDGRTPYDSLLQVGIRAYSLQDYPSAIKALASFTQKDSLQEAGVFYLAMSYLGQREGHLAISLFQEIPIESPFNEARDWYLALSYLENEQLEKAEAKLEEIEKNASHSYQLKASNLRKVLN